MELWTLQNPAVYDELLKTGSYMVDPSRIGFPEEEDTDTIHLNGAYKWMASKMDERLGARPDGAEYPVWAWYKQQGRDDGKPDMRQSHYDMPGAPLVRMRLEVPDELVLLSCDDQWDFALNYWYLALSEEDDARFDARWKAAGLKFDQLGDFGIQSPELEGFRREIVESWDRMLDVFGPQGDQWEFPWKMRSIQATFWELKLEYVKSVEYFIAR